MCLSHWVSSSFPGVERMRLFDCKAKDSAENLSVE